LFESNGYLITRLKTARHTDDNSRGDNNCEQRCIQLGFRSKQLG
jgi:hypothetical protein